MPGDGFATREMVSARYQCPVRLVLCHRPHHPQRKPENYAKLQCSMMTHAKNNDALLPNNPRLNSYPVLPGKIGKVPKMGPEKSKSSNN